MCFASWDLNCFLNFEGNFEDPRVTCSLLIAEISASPPKQAISTGTPSLVSWWLTEGGGEGGGLVAVVGSFVFSLVFLMV